MSAEIPGAVVITLREIYDEQKGTREDVQKVLARLEDQSASIKDHEDRIRELEKSNPADQEERLKGLERFRWLSMGAATLLGGGGGAFLSQIVSKGA
ncbi:hypothetical protein [Prauserella muralis]|uniref:Uncharacterized protein n=1 Tax=Prauserella muralis TaxID=588067 RepID=A0A2V4AKN7_9PSEU|nr:hypothetical protein [Prauserella muralis]PXY20871.1 hypothetical protein BAY60_25545 [Prauserella muralis]TWE29911.1 hypothetical protein FHX69_2604 [Prauserella muralis]